MPDASLDASEAALAMAEVVHGPRQLFLAEIGPVERRAPVLRVGGLPEQEVAQPHLASRANDQIRVTQTTGVEIAAEELFVQLFGGDPVPNQFSRRLDDLGPAPVVEGDVERKAAIVAGQVDGVQDSLLQLRWKPIERADVPQPNAVGVKLSRLAVDHLAENLHQARDLVVRAAPVLGRESVQRQDLDPEFDTALDDPADVLGPSAMSCQPFEAALVRPAPVAIHDDRHVLGD